MSGPSQPNPTAGGWHPIRWLRTHAAAADLLLALLLTSMTLAFHLVDPEVAGESYRDPTWWTVPFVIAAVFPVAWRRSRPILVAMVVLVVDVVAILLDINGTGLIGVVVALYSVGAHSSGRTRTRAVIGFAVVLGVLFVAGLFSNDLDVGGFVSSTVVLVTAYVLGDNLRRRRDAAQALQERLERAERERELLAHQRVTAERARIARELHDVVAHSVSVMVIQAAAARRNLASSPDVAEEALVNIETTGRHTMDELRGVLGVLRRTEGPPDQADRMLAPTPTLRSLPALVEAAGDLPVELQMAGDLDDLPTAVDLTGYRVVQEALTNVRRHAGPVSSVVVRVERGRRDLVIEVLDDGRGAAADDGGEGFGLTGMRERVAAADGSIEAGWRAGGGWRVRATLPLARTPGDRSIAAAGSAESAGSVAADVAAPDATADATVSG